METWVENPKHQRDAWRKPPVGLLQAHALESWKKLFFIWKQWPRGRCWHVAVVFALLFPVPSLRYLLHKRKSWLPALWRLSAGAGRFFCCRHRGFPAREATSELWTDMQNKKTSEKSELRKPFSFYYPTTISTFTAIYDNQQNLEPKRLPFCLVLCS